MNNIRSKNTRVVMTTFGSLGDLHPYLALAFEMKRRSIEPVIVTSNVYRTKIESAGIEFAPMRPGLPDLDSSEALEIIDRIFDPKRGAEFLFKHLLAPAVRDSYRDLEAATRGCDLLVTHPMTIAGPLVAEKTGIPWVSTVLAPASLWSDYDPVVPPNSPWLYRVMRYGGPSVTALIRRAIETLTSPWVKPVYELRQELGLSGGRHPIFAGQFSPELNLALFSNAIYEAPGDVPPNTVVTGFPFYDGADNAPLTPEISDFLASGPAPIVFTLGSSAVHIAGDFFRESIDAARITGQRAVFLIGSERNLPVDNLPDGMIAAAYAPYGELFPSAAMVVHQGGIGTTAQTLRAGVPMLVMPYNHDQHDNAARVERLGVARTVERNGYRSMRVAEEIKVLLGQSKYRQQAAHIREQISKEDGAGRAVKSILRLIRGRINEEGERAAGGLA